MSEHVNIHIYGNCGAPCPGDSPLGCLQYLARSENTHLDLTSQTSNLMPWPHPYTSHFFMYYSSNIFQSVPSVSFPMRIQPLAPVDLLINLRQLTYHYSTSIFISFLDSFTLFFYTVLFIQSLLFSTPFRLSLTLLQLN